MLDIKAPSKVVVMETVCYWFKNKQKRSMGQKGVLVNRPLQAYYISEKLAQIGGKGQAH